jgi:hypothetical protein
MASGNTLAIFRAQDCQPPATAFAQFDTIAGASTPAESIPVLEFEDGTATSGEYADFYGVLPRTYGGGGLTLTIYWLSSATTGNCVWKAAFRRIADDAEDLDTTAHTYDYNSVTATTANAAGELDYAAITFTDGADMDSLAVGEAFILRIFRDGDDGGDTLSGDAGLFAVEIKET